MQTRATIHFDAAINFLPSSRPSHHVLLVSRASSQTHKRRRACAQSLFWPSVFTPASGLWSRPAEWAWAKQTAAARGRTRSSVTASAAPGSQREQTAAWPKADATVGAAAAAQKSPSLAVDGCVRKWLSLSTNRITQIDVLHCRAWTISRSRFLIIGITEAVAACLKRRLLNTRKKY